MKRTWICVAYRTTMMLVLLAICGTIGTSPLWAKDAGFDSTPSAQDDSTLVSQDAPPGSGSPPFSIPVAKQSLSDLTLGNFFSDGWNDDYSLRTRATGTPDYPLLRVQTNELLRLFRTNFYEQSNLNNATRKNLVDLDAFMDWSFNRRIMIELGGAYQWADMRGTANEISGGNSYGLVRIKLFDTQGTELSSIFKVAAPNPALAVVDTTITYGITGFEDLAYWTNLDRVGLYYSFVVDNLAGPAAVGAQRNDVQYDVSIAKTITAHDNPIVGDLTLFEETFVQTTLDGPTPRTYVTETPGLRFNFGPCDAWKMGKFNALIMGVDLPISSYQPWSETWRVSYVKCF